jgi:hypothetical protein
VNYVVPSRDVIDVTTESLLTAEAARRASYLPPGTPPTDGNLAETDDHLTVAELAAAKGLFTLHFADPHSGQRSPREIFAKIRELGTSPQFESKFVQPMQQRALQLDEIAHAWQTRR